jgi:integrase
VRPRLCSQYRGPVTAVIPSTVRPELNPDEQADEAANHGLLPTEVAAVVSRIRGPQSHRRRAGNWLTSEEAVRLLWHPDRSTLAGKQDYTILALALTAGLRRGELVSLIVDDVQATGRLLVLLDIAGKQNRVRTVAG